MLVWLTSRGRFFVGKRLIERAEKVDQHPVVVVNCIHMSPKR